jgi:hypothetical protein
MERLSLDLSNLRLLSIHFLFNLTTTPIPPSTQKEKRPEIS